MASHFWFATCRKLYPFYDTSFPFFVCIELLLLYIFYFIVGGGFV